MPEDGKKAQCMNTSYTDDLCCTNCGGRFGGNWDPRKNGDGCLVWLEYRTKHYFAIDSVASVTPGWYRWDRDGTSLDNYHLASSGPEE